MRMNESPTTQADPTVAALRRFVVECPDLREFERSLGRFNVFDVLKHLWAEWMTAMGVKRFEFVKTDLRSNVDQGLQNYVLGLN